MSAPGHQGRNEPAPRESDPAPDAVAALQVGIRRQGNTVEIVLTSRDDYDAIALYDHLLRSLQQGSLHLDIARGQAHLRR